MRTKSWLGRPLPNSKPNAMCGPEVLDGVQEIKASKGKQTNVEAKSYVVRVRFTTQLYSDPYFLWIWWRNGIRTDCATLIP